MAAESWGVRVGDFIRAYLDWSIRGGPGAVGFVARRRGPTGQPRGAGLFARTLDELAEMIASAELE